MKKKGGIVAFEAQAGEPRVEREHVVRLCLFHEQHLELINRHRTPQVLIGASATGLSDKHRLRVGYPPFARPGPLGIPLTRALCAIQPALTQ
jgi:hypothetical protein